MFTGIIESTGKIISIEKKGENLQFTIESVVSNELKPDQSLAHDGVCLTIEQAGNNTHTVTAIAETLSKTTLQYKKAGDSLNLERCLPFNGRIDGHLVQGHVDEVTTCTERYERNGSIEFSFSIPAGKEALLVEKGSVTINGISLTCFEVTQNSFKVAVIPYTLQHTNIGSLQPGSFANIEFDIIGKYIQRNTALYRQP